MSRLFARAHSPHARDLPGPAQPRDPPSVDDLVALYRDRFGARLAPPAPGEHASTLRLLDERGDHIELCVAEEGLELHTGSAGEDGAEAWLEKLFPPTHDRTGWYLYDADGFLIWRPEGACQHCREPYFGWHHRCVRCGESPQGRPALGPYLGKARTFLDGLVARGLLEQVEGADSYPLADRIGRYWKAGGRNLGRVLSMLEQHPSTEELYGTDEDVAAALAALVRLPR